MFLSVHNSFMYIYEQDRGCTGIWLSSRWSLRKERGLLNAEVVEKPREMMRGRTDREGGRWWGWKYWLTLGSGYERPLISLCPCVVRGTKTEAHVTVHACIWTCFFILSTVYTHISAHFFICVFLCWKGSLVEWEMLCAVSLRHHMPQGLTLLSAPLWLHKGRKRKRRRQARERRAGR